MPADYASAHDAEKRADAAVDRDDRSAAAANTASTANS
jgi:hypothetical protein